MTKKAEKEITVKKNINAPIKLNVTDAALAKLKKKFEKVPDVSKKDAYEFVRVGLGELRTLRTGAGKHKATLKAEAIAYNKRVDAEYNRVIEAIEAIEGPMKAAKDAEDAKKEAIREEKRKAEELRKFNINQKINEIREIAFSLTDETSEAIRKEIDTIKGIQITKDVYEEFLTAAQMAVIDVKTKLEALLENVVAREKADAERKLEDERLAKEREKLDEEKAAADKETERLKAIADNLDRIKNLPFGYDGSDSSDIALGIASLEAMIVTEDEFDEFTENAEKFKTDTLIKLKALESQAKEKEDLQKKKEELDERERKANEEREAAEEEARLAEEKALQEKEAKKAQEKDKELHAKRKQEALDALEECCINQDTIQNTVHRILESIMSGGIPHVHYDK
jgi:hypothetical protein